MAAYDERGLAMRYMMFVKLPADMEPDYMPKAEDVEQMMKYNEELSKAGVLLALDGLAPLSEGAVVGFAGGRGKVLDGPFAEVKELVGGYWIIQVSSKEEAIEWAKRCPMSEGDVIEVRRIFETNDFPDDVQEELSKFPLGSQQPAG
jgi:hypothetical protein